jgi:SAM-dependent methyltransferase
MIRLDVPDPGEYGERWAAIYDSYPAHPSAEDAEPAADFLFALANGGRALEFGIGTGRIALPLAARGLEVWGIEASRAMLDRLAEKPGGDGIRAVLGDITRDRAAGSYRLVYAAFNTVLMVPTQAGQVQCFRNAAAHLEADGFFVVEAFVPDFAKLAAGDAVQVRHIDDEGAWLLSTHHDALLQVIASETIRVGSNGTERYPITLRYAWPPELDLMAELAGLRLVERTANWSRAPFTEASRNQVSVYRLS